MLRNSIGVLALFVLPLSAVGCSSGDAAGARKAVEATAKTLTPADFGQIVAHVRGDGGGSFGHSPFDRTLVISDAQPGTLTSRLVQRLREAGLKSSVPTGGSTLPTSWSGRVDGQPINAYVKVLEPGSRYLRQTIPPGQVGISFDINGSA